jgi:hypothetical protein
MGHIGDAPIEESGAIRTALARNGRVQALRKAAGGSPDSKGPAGIGKFGDFTPQNFTEWADAANPYGTAATFEEAVRGNLGAPARPTGNLGNAIRQAAGVGPQHIPLPEMEGRLFKAFTDAEGRDPEVGDTEFWKALVTVKEAYGEQVAAEVRAAADGIEIESVHRLRKALDDGTAPDWMKGLAKKHDFR